MKKKIQQLDEDERGVKQVVALTGDHWTYFSNDNYLGATAHIIDNDWKLQLFELNMQRTTSSHFRDACTGD